MEEHVRAPVLPRERVDLFLKLLALPVPDAPLMNPLLASAEGAGEITTYTFLGGRNGRTPRRSPHIQGLFGQSRV